MKELADDSFKFDKNGRKFSNVYKTLWEREKLLVPQCFQKTYTADT